MDTNWLPRIPQDDTPIYRALADQIRRDIDCGVLDPGMRLPPVRNLAWRLQITPGTVARAYRLGVDRGALKAVVGRGTFVRDDDHRNAASPFAPHPGSSLLDLRLNRAPFVRQDEIIARALTGLIARRGPLPLTDYRRFDTDAPERETAAAWLRSGGVPARAADLLLTSGAQHALMLAIAGTSSAANKLILTEPLVHPGIKDCAAALGVRLEPVAMDADGIIPEALDEAALRLRPDGALFSANHHNPTLAHMPPARRDVIAEVARRRNFAIIEDDVYGWLDEVRAPSFAELAPERCYYISSLSKCVAAGLRAGFMLCPSGETGRIYRLLKALTDNAPFLVTGLAAELIRNGDADRIRNRVRAEVAARAQIAGAALGPFGARTAPGAAIAWLPLPECWRASDFRTALEAQKVLALTAETFAVGRAQAPHRIRIALGGGGGREDFTRAIGIVAAQLKRAPDPAAVYA